jgi:UDP-N-acetylglucosamine 2-epimerase (non-hydrolysing)
VLTVLSVFGTRPEAIKMAPVIQRLADHPGRIRSVTCSVGQHREMLNQVLPLFGIRPDHELDVMQPDQGLSQLTSALFAGLDRVVRDVEPDWVLAQGDTTSVFVASMVAYYRRVCFGHVEAGLRTGDKHRPFPEEINRRIADLVSDLHFAPTERARQALLREGCRDEDVHVTGNTVVDALNDVVARPYDWSSSPLARLPRKEMLVLITAHRRESFGEPFRDLCLAIRDLSRRFQNGEVQFVYPVHLNPNVRKPVSEILSGLSNVSLIDPLDYLSLVQLLKRSTVILTDSGGIQEEGVGLRVPVLVMRDTTERPEGVEAGAARLVGTSRERIFAETERLLTDPQARREMAVATNPYGDGRAGERIVSLLLDRSPSSLKPVVSTASR